jgi:hypothetical protein
MLASARVDGRGWWADVLADPRARTRKRRVDMAVKQAAYRLSDEQRATILVECTKCDWKAVYGRDELIASHGAEYPMPSLLNELAKPGCTRLCSQWDHCGVHYVVPIEAEMTPSASHWRHSSHRREAGGAQPPCCGDQIKQNQPAASGAWRSRPTGDYLNWAAHREPDWSRRCVHKQPERVPQ